jgi:Putative adhesin
MTQTNEHVTTIDHQVGARGRFTLRQASGEIRIRGVEGDRIRVRSLDDDRSLDSLFHVNTGADYVELRQIEKFGLGILSFTRGDAPDIAVEVPHGATVSVDSASAEVAVSDLSGSKRFRSASGDLNFERLAGPLDVESVSGDVGIEGQAPLELAAKSISGDIHVRVPRLRRLEMTTTSGDIWLDAQLDGNGPFSLRSISGDVTLVGRSGFRIEAQSVTGDLNSDLPSKRESGPGRKIMTVGRPGPTLTFHSVSGDFNVVEPRDAAPESVAPPTPPAPAVPPAPGAPAASGGASTTATSNPNTDLDAARLEILKALERGEMTVPEATDRLGELDEMLR